jgi:phospholipid-binding lipoprotein MlaA
MRERIIKLLATLCACALALSGCASQIPAAPKEERSPDDPWEPMNRSIHTFNQNIDKAFFKPLAHGYVKVIPGPVRQGINNFSMNLLGPLYIINNFLQGKFKRGFSETGRFLANTTVGLLGFINAGQHMGMEVYREDFGQTLAVWGVPDGPFVVVPFFGPRTLRHAAMIPLNLAADPTFYIDDDVTRWSLYLVRAVDLRAELFRAEELMGESFDPYLTIRESYLQNRLFLIFDGSPPEDEDFYDDFEDPEDFEDY